MMHSEIAAARPCPTMSEETLESLQLLDFRAAEIEDFLTVAEDLFEELHRRERERHPDGRPIAVEFRIIETQLRAAHNLAHDLVLLGRRFNVEIDGGGPA